MTKTYCDKCGKDCSHATTVYLPYTYGENEDKLSVDGVEVREYDLCEYCLNKLKKWIDEDDKGDNN